MEFRVLGPLEIERAGSRVVVRAGHELAVLARLLLEPGTPVSRGVLVEGLWRETPPPSAARTIDSILSRWRSRLGGDTIERVAAGTVRLNVPSDAVDAVAFRQVLSDAEDASVIDPARALALVDRALAMWRGQPFPELVDWPDAVPVVARLAEMRAHAEELRLDCVLRTGKYAEAVGAAEQLVAAEPLREQRWAQLITALAASNRQADALRAYARCRSMLIEQLGLEPGPLLADLERRVLAGDPVMDAPRGLRTPSLPAPTDGFFGREDELATIAAVLTERRIVTLTGSGGIGKTRLALQAAGALGYRFPDGVHLVELAALAAGSDVDFTVADALGVKRQGQRSAVASVIDWLGARQVLVVVDNAEHVLEPVRRSVEILTRSCPNVRILVTSRRPLDVRGEHLVDVPPLGSSADPRHALALFHDRAHSRRAPRAGDVETDVAAAICQVVDFLPLAIELAAARVRTWTPKEILDQLRTVPDLLSGGERAGRHDGLDHCVDWSLALLSPDERWALAQLVPFHGGFDLVAADHVLDRPARELLHALVGHSLVVAQPVEATETRFRMLEPIRQRTIERFGTPAHAVERHARYYAALATEIDAAFLGEAAGWATRMFDVELPNLRAALRTAIERGLVELAVDLVVDLGWIAREQINMEVLTWAEQVRAAATGASASVCDTLDATCVGFHFLDLDDVSVTRLTTQVLASPSASPLARYRAVFNEAWTSFNLGRVDDATRAAWCALDEADAIGNDVLRSGALSTVAVCLQRSADAGDRHRAERYAREAVRVAGRSDYASATSLVFAARFAPEVERVGILRRAVDHAERAGIVQFVNVARRMLAEELLLAGAPVGEPARLLAVCLATWERLRVRTHWLVTLEVAAQCLAVHGRHDVADHIWTHQLAEGFTPATALRRSALGVAPPVARPGLAPLGLDVVSSMALGALTELAETRPD